MNLRVAFAFEPERRCRIAGQAGELNAEEMAFCELCKARALTQANVALELDISQDAISRLERHGDLSLSVLCRTAEATGGSLSLITRFPDRPPVEFAGIAEHDARD